MQQCNVIFYGRLKKNIFVALAKNEKEDFHFNNISVLKYLLRETLKNFHF
jgi:hypothetical protein